MVIKHIFCCHLALKPEQLFEMHRRRRAEPSCLGDEVCAPSAARVERVLTLEGSVSVSVTDECACQPRSHSCRRRPHRVTLHNDTPLQTTVDIGDCHGHCAHGTSHASGLRLAVSFLYGFLHKISSNIIELCIKVS